jgi:3-deoxy-manno-octulosonate cytidylyltransferase (CMP-KDO synthetase)
VDADVYVNVQGDEPLIDPKSIDAAVRALLADESAGWSTLVAPLRTRAEYEDPSVVKVAVAEDVAAASGAVSVALYFSRAPIPYKRGLAAGEAPPPSARRHVGLYAFRKSALERFASWPPSPLETCESLEQLRALERGVRIVVAETSGLSLAVDNPEDVPAVEARLRATSAPEER